MDCLREQNDIDLSLLADHFTTCGDYTKDVILKELQYWQKNCKDFLVLVYGDIDGFLIGYRYRNSLWLSQIWLANGNPKIAHEAFKIARNWAKARGMISIIAETDRDEVRAMKKYGFTEYAVVMRTEI